MFSENTGNLSELVTEFADSSISSIYEHGEREKMLTNLLDDWTMLVTISGGCCVARGITSL
jgi:hypothetical protein